MREIDATDTFPKYLSENYTLVQLLGSFIMAISFKLPSTLLAIASCQTQLTSANCYTQHGCLLPSSVHYRKWPMAGMLVLWKKITLDWWQPWLESQCLISILLFPLKSLSNIIFSTMSNSLFSRNILSYAASISNQYAPLPVYWDQCHLV